MCTSAETLIERVVDLEPEGRWSRVNGALSSAIATLLDHGWRLPKVGLWISPNGAEWQVDFSLGH